MGMGTSTTVFGGASMGMGTQPTAGFGAGFGTQAAFGGQQMGTKAARFELTRTQVPWRDFRVRLPGGRWDRRMADSTGIAGV